jgi:hypothetical protein
MKAFICVYQHPIPSKREWRLTESAAADDPLLRDFLARYHDDDFFYDWGDDPSFYSATNVLGDARAASWGVCRRDVRSQLREGDFIVWFCARTHRLVSGAISYFFIGVSTVLSTIDRRQLTDDADFSRYRPFYNKLIAVSEGTIKHQEIFHGYHSDWANRIKAPYVLFNPSPDASCVELKKPLLVAKREPNERIEKWRSALDPRVAMLEKILFVDTGVARRLRTTSFQNTHRQIPLHNYCCLRQDLIPLRKRLISFVSSRY